MRHKTLDYHRTAERNQFDPVKQTVLAQNDESLHLASRGCKHYIALLHDIEHIVHGGNLRNMVSQRARIHMKGNALRRFRTIQEMFSQFHHKYAACLCPSSIAETAPNTTIPRYVKSKPAPQNLEQLYSQNDYSIWKSNNKKSSLLMIAYVV